VPFDSQIVKKVMDYLGADTTIPLPLVSSNILEKFIQYCRHHVLHAPHHVNSMWDSEFLQTLEISAYKLIYHISAYKLIYIKYIHISNENNIPHL
jgi:hypothetical protein